MLKYFRFPSKSVGGFHVTEKNETVKEINEYAEENGLKIIQISACDDNGLFVVFEPLNYAKLIDEVLPKYCGV